MGGPLIPHSSWAGSLESTPDTCVAEAYQGNELGTKTGGGTGRAWRVWEESVSITVDWEGLAGELGFTGGRAG